MANEKDLFPDRDKEENNRIMQELAKTMSDLKNQLARNPVGYGGAAVNAGRFATSPYAFQNMNNPNYLDTMGSQVPIMASNKMSAMMYATMGDNLTNVFFGRGRSGINSLYTKYFNQDIGKDTIREFKNEVGTAAGSVALGFIPGVGAPLALANQVIGAQNARDIKMQNEMSQTLLAKSGSFMFGSAANNILGEGMSRGDRKNISKYVNDLSYKDYKYAPEEIKAAFDTSISNNAYTTVRSAEQFKKKFEERLESVKKISTYLGQTLSQADNTLRKMELLGANDTKTMKEFSLKMEYVRKAFGVSRDEAADIMGTGTQIAASRNVDRRAGARTSMSVMSTVGSTLSGILTEDYFKNFKGMDKENFDLFNKTINNPEEKTKAINDISDLIMEKTLGGASGDAFMAAGLRRGKDGKLEADVEKMRDFASGKMSYKDFIASGMANFNQFTDEEQYQIMQKNKVMQEKVSKGMEVAGGATYLGLEAVRQEFQIDKNDTIAKILNKIGDRLDENSKQMIAVMLTNTQAIQQSERALKKNEQERMILNEVMMKRSVRNWSDNIIGGATDIARKGAQGMQWFGNRILDAGFGLFGDHRTTEARELEAGQEHVQGVITTTTTSDENRIKNQLNNFSKTYNKIIAQFNQQAKWTAGALEEAEAYKFFNGNSSLANDDIGMKTKKVRSAFQTVGKFDVAKLYEKINNDPQFEGLKEILGIQGKSVDESKKEIEGILSYAVGPLKRKKKEKVLEFLGKTDYIRNFDPYAQAVDVIPKEFDNAKYMEKFVNNDPRSKTAKYDIDTVLSRMIENPQDFLSKSAGIVPEGLNGNISEGIKVSKSGNYYYATQSNLEDKYKSHKALATDVISNVPDFVSADKNIIGRILQSFTSKSNTISKEALSDTNKSDLQLYKEIVDRRGYKEGSEEQKAFSATRKAMITATNVAGGHVYQGAQDLAYLALNDYKIGSKTANRNSILGIQSSVNDLEQVTGEISGFMDKQFGINLGEDSERRYNVSKNITDYYFNKKTNAASSEEVDRYVYDVYSKSNEDEKKRMISGVADYMKQNEKYVNDHVEDKTFSSITDINKKAKFFIQNLTHRRGSSYDFNLMDITDPQKMQEQILDFTKSSIDQKNMRVNYTDAAKAIGNDKIIELLSTLVEVEKTNGKITEEGYKKIKENAEKRSGDISEDMNKYSRQRIITEQQSGTNNVGFFGGAVK